MLEHRRQKLMVDEKVQGALVLRAIAYWSYCLLSIALMIVCWVIVTDRPSSSLELFRRVWGLYGPALIASVIVLPIVVVDVIRLTNRFAGPAFRMHKTIKRFADGRAVEPVEFREGDFWCEFAEDFNRALARMQSDCAAHNSDANPLASDESVSCETSVAV